jgi:hypothetical protein
MIDFTRERLEELKRNAAEPARSGKPLKDAVTP